MSGHLCQCAVWKWIRAFGDTVTDLNQAKDKQDQLSSQYEDTKKQLEQLQQESADTKSYIEQLDGKMSTLDSSLQSLNTQIEDMQNQIEEARSIWNRLKLMQMCSMIR